MTSMGNSESDSLSSQDFPILLQSIVDYVRDAPTSILNLQHVPWDTCNKDHLQPIFEALVGSDVTELQIEGNPLSNKMQHLSSILSKTKIEKLDLRSCKLTSKDFMSLMAVLKETRITYLNLSCNHNIRLRGSVTIKKIIDYLINSRLRSLNLSFSTMLPVEKMPVFFRGLPNTEITSLNLSGFFSYEEHSSRKNCLRSLNVLVSSLQNTFIKDLDLGSNKFGDDLAKNIGPFLGKSKLEKLGLSNVGLTDCGVDLLVPGLIESKITHLDLSSNEIHGHNTLGSCLQQMKIKLLDLSRNLMTSTEMFPGLDVLLSSDVRDLLLNHDWYSTKREFPLEMRILRFSKLNSLALNHYTLNLEQFAALIDILSQTNLTQISLVDNNLSEENFKALGECLIKSKLKHINLSHNKIRSSESYIDHTKSVTSLIEKTKGSGVDSLNLSFSVPEFGTSIIAQSLANTTFLVLDFEGNSLKDSIASFSEQLKFTSIVALNLDKTYIGNDGAKVLAENLGETKIVTLSLRDNSITSRGAIFLAQVLDQTRLRHLDLSDNHIENDGLESLAEYATNSCVTYINVKGDYGRGTQLLHSVMWENRKKLQIFADLLKRTAFFTGRSDLFESDRDLVAMDVEVFIDDCLNLYKMVAKDPWLVNAIEQDKFISDLKKVERFDCYQCSMRASRPCFYDDVDFFIDSSSLIYQKVMTKSIIQNTTDLNTSVLFRKQILREILDEFPRKLVCFTGSAIEADVEQHVTFLKKIESSGLTDIVELLLLNRPVYMIDDELDILHPHVYVLLHKYKQPICNLDIEPKGVEKIIKYFTDHHDSADASEVISLLGGGISI